MDFFPVFIVSPLWPLWFKNFISNIVITLEIQQVNEIDSYSRFKVSYLSLYNTGLQTNYTLSTQKHVYCLTGCKHIYIKYIDKHATR